MTAHNVDRDGTPFVLDAGHIRDPGVARRRAAAGRAAARASALHRLSGLTLDLVEGCSLLGAQHHPRRFLPLSRAVVRGAVRPESRWSISAGSRWRRPRPAVLSEPREPRDCAAEHVELTAICDGDRERLFEWINDREEVLLNAGYSPVHERDHVRLVRRDPPPSGHRDLRDPPLADGALIGSCQLLNIDRRHSTADLQIRIGARGARGQGYGTEAVRLPPRARLPRPRPRARPAARLRHATRARSAPTRRRACARRGVLRSAAYIDGERCDVVVMGILRR